MERIRILILEDDMEAISKLLIRLALLNDKLNKEGKDLSVTVFSEYIHVENYINKLDKGSFRIILLDRDCKLGGSFHCLDLNKYPTKSIIGISSIPEYNEILKKRGVDKLVHKNYEDLESFSIKVIEYIEEIIR